MPSRLSSFKTHEDYLNWYREYRKRNSVKIKKYKREYIARQRKKGGYFKDNVRIKVYRAIKEGKRKRQPCQVCGEIRVQAHHKDYSKPLEVDWFCVPHHKIADRLLKLSTPTPFTPITITTKLKTMEKQFYVGDKVRLPMPDKATVKAKVVEVKVAYGKTRYVIELTEARGQMTVEHLEID